MIQSILITKVLVNMKFRHVPSKKAHNRYPTPKSSHNQFLGFDNKLK